MGTWLPSHGPRSTTDYKHTVFRCTCGQILRTAMVESCLQASRGQVLRTGLINTILIRYRVDVLDGNIFR